MQKKESSAILSGKKKNGFDDHFDDSFDISFDNSFNSSFNAAQLR